MLNRFKRLASYVGITGLDFRITAGERDRLMWASTPAVVLATAMTAAFAIDANFGAAQEFGGRMPKFWEKMLYAANSIESVMLPLSLAVLFFMGIGRIGRGVGSWCALVAGICIVGCIAFGALSSVISVAVDRNEAYSDWYQYTWLAWSGNFGIIAVGYAFLAYRGSRPASGGADGRGTGTRG